MTGGIFLIKACLLVLLAYLATIHFFVTNGGRAYPSAINLFLLYQGLGFVGTVLHADLAYAGDRTRAFGMLLGLGAVVLGGAMANALFAFRPRDELTRFRLAPVIQDARGPKLRFVLVPIAAVSVLVGFVYMSAMGYNLPLELLKAYSSTGDVSSSASIYGQMRTSVWNDPSRYIAPGYSAQFMKILLPAVSFIWFFRARATRRWGDRFVAGGLMVAALYLLAGTGIRSYLLLFGAYFVVLVSPRLGPFAGNRSGSRAVWLVGGVAALGFALLTFLGGRSARGGSLLSNVGGVVWDLVERVVFVTADVQLVAMRALGSFPRGWGRGWMDSLAVLLPGSRPSRSTEIYEIVYGGFGNAPLDLWTSLWLEFGWAGLVFVPLVLGGVLQYVHIRFVRGPKLLTRTVVFTMMAFTLIIISEPIDVFNNGLVTLLILLALLSASTLLWMNRAVPVRASLGRSTRGECA